jgi:hypothetical protein
VKSLLRLTIAAGTAAVAVAGLATVANASTTASEGAFFGAHNAVFVQTDNLSGNQIIAYHRDYAGHLTEVGDYSTGGLGGQLVGSVADHLASQSSLAYDARTGELLAVNAGSNTVSVFQAFGDRLVLRQVVSSGGTFPVSVAVHGDVAYVLNALNGGSVQGFRVRYGFLTPLADSNRALGLDPNATPQFTHTPGQVGFAADGSKLVVTTKAAANSIDVFPLGPSGVPSAAPVVTSLPGTVPFALVTDETGRIDVAEAGPDAVAAFTVNPDGTLTSGPVIDLNQAATCWIAKAGDYLFAANAGSATLSGLSVQADGSFASLGNTSTDPGAVDSAATPNGHYLYEQTGVHGIVDEFTVSDNGSLTEVGSVTVPNAAGAEGIVAF